MPSSEKSVRDVPSAASESIELAMPPRCAVDASHVAANAHTDSTHQWVLLVLSTLVIVLSFVLHVGGTEKVVVPVIDAPLPASCVWRTFLGLDCPGCGLTRCFISLARGQWRLAWEFNAAGLLLFGIVAFQIPFRAIQIWRIRRGIGPWYIGGLGWLTCSALVLSLLGQWLFRLAGWIGSA